MPLRARIPALHAAALLAACAPKAPAGTDTDASTATGETTGASTTTGAPTTAAPLTTGEPTTAAPTTEEPPEAFVCVRRTGPAESDVDWIFRCGGPTFEDLRGLAVDPVGDLYLGVELRDAGGGAPIRIGEFEVVPGALSDILLVKLSSAGEPLWVRHFTGPDDQGVRSLIACGDGLVITGWASKGSLDLGGGPLPDSDFLASFDAGGAHRWSRSIPGLARESYVTLAATACDGAGALAVAGSFHGTIDLGGGPLQASEPQDGFVARYDPAGALAWTRPFQLTGEGDAIGTAVAFTPAGELVVTGLFRGTIDLGGGPLVADLDDILVARLTGDGAHVWSQNIGGPGRQYGRAVAVDAAGRIAVGGQFLEAIAVGDDDHLNVIPDPVPDIEDTPYDGVLVVLDPDGGFVRSHHLGTPPGDDITDLVFGTDGALLVGARLDGVLALRRFAGVDETWTWSTDQFDRGRVVFPGADAAVVAASPIADVDLGVGLLAGRGETDLVVARIRR